MTINKENYPEYFLDFFEGRLSEADKAELFDFLDWHPALKIEFDAFEPLALEPESIDFPDRESLKRGQVTPSNYDWYFAAYVEGDLTGDEREAVEHFVMTNPEMGRELRMMQGAFLVADDAVKLIAKAALKRPVMVATQASDVEAAGTVSSDEFVGAAIADGGSYSGPLGTVKRSLMVRPWWQYVSAAAVVLLMAGLFFMRTPEPGNTHFAYDMPAVEEADKPEAVADIPSSAGMSNHQTENLIDASARVPVKAFTAVTSPPVQMAERSTDYNAIVQQNSSLISDGLVSMKAIHVIQPVRLLQSDWEGRIPTTIEYKTEFAYWRQDLLPTDYYTPEEHELLAQDEADDSNLTQLALSSLQKSLPIDFSRVDDHLYHGRIPLKELASRGLIELGVTATNLLGIEREVDDEGRILAIRAGWLFEARRNRR